MARANIFSIKLDLSQVDAFAQTLANLQPDELAPLLIGKLNEVAGNAYKLSRFTITNSVNLTDNYVGRRIELVEASEGRGLKAEIVASGDRKLMTNLSHYGAMQGTQPVEWSNERIRGMGKKFAPWPGWEMRRGDEARGISVGSKLGKMSAEVTRGSRKSIGRKFTIPGKEDREGNLLVFEATGAPGRGKRDRNRIRPRGGVRALYGPSVYQLFRTAATRISDDVGVELQQAIADEAAKQFNRIIEK